MAFRDRERREREREIEDEEELYERKRLERKLREKETAYQEVIQMLTKLCSVLCTNEGSISILWT